MNKEQSNFLATVDELFSFLEAVGFHRDDSAIECTDLYCVVPYIGKNVGIYLSYDKKEDYSECYIGKIVGGKRITNRDMGGYWGTLISFLYSNRSFRGKIPIDEQLLNKKHKELYGYKKLLTTTAKDILDDKEEVFQ